MKNEMHAPAILLIKIAFACSMLMLVIMSAHTLFVPATHAADDKKSGMVLLSPEIPLIDTKEFDGSTASMSNLMNAFLSIAIVISAVLAVIMVAIGGFKYMTTDSVFQISGAKEQIANAIIGLLVVLMAILILWTINPQIVNLKLFDKTDYIKSS